jgi:hypothetical protein
MTVVAGMNYPKQLWRFTTRRRFVPLKDMRQHRGGVRRPKQTVWPCPHWVNKYVATLFRREKHPNWFAIRDLSRRTAKRYAEGRKNTYPDCAKNYWGDPYS